jgi:cation:H+ antiporter
MTIFLLVAGFVLLLGGAEGLVRGASSIAERAGISPLVVGLTVVAFGTSAPEMAVSIGSSVAGQGDLALGNVVGSNVFNVLFILGLSAVVAPLAVSSQLVRIDVPLMIGTSLLAFALALDGTLGRVDGGLLFGGIVLYTVFQIVQGRRASPEGEAETGGSVADASATGASDQGESMSVWAAGLLAVGGLGLLILGARWLVDGAVAVAEAAGLSELVIGLTIVAGGTSLPELATSILASLRGARDIAVGNVVGSNVFNLLGVLGASALAAPEGIAVAPGVLWMDLPVMLAVAVACLPIFLTGHVVSRWEGVLFTGYYAAYTTYLVLTATVHPSLSSFTGAMTAFVLPLTAVTLVVALIRDRRRRGGVR